MGEESLHIAWLGAGPRARETGGVPGVATDLLHGLAQRGHRVECIFAGEPHELPERLDGLENLSIVWSGLGWRWSGWYTKTRIGAFVSGLLARGFASLRLRREVARRHRRDPFDVVYQFSSIETLSLPASVRRAGPAGDPPRDPRRRGAAVPDLRAPPGAPQPAGLHARGRDRACSGCGRWCSGWWSAERACWSASAPCSATTWYATSASRNRTRSWSRTRYA